MGGIFFSGVNRARETNNRRRGGRRARKGKACWLFSLLFLFLQPLLPIILYCGGRGAIESRGGSLVCMGFFPQSERKGESFFFFVTSPFFPPTHVTILSNPWRAPPIVFLFLFPEGEIRQRKGQGRWRRGFKGRARTENRELKNRRIQAS